MWFDQDSQKNGYYNHWVLPWGMRAWAPHWAPGDLYWEEEPQCLALKTDRAYVWESRKAVRNQDSSFKKHVYTLTCSESQGRDSSSKRVWVTFEGALLTNLINVCWRCRDMLDCSLGSKAPVGIFFIFLLLPFSLACLVAFLALSIYCAKTTCPTLALSCGLAALYPSTSPRASLKHLLPQPP